MSVAQIERARTELGLTYAEIAAALKVDESTLHRWRAGRERQRSSAGARGIEGLSLLMDAQAKRFGNDHRGANAWMDTPNASCGGDTPRVWLRDGRADYLAGLLVGDQAPEPTAGNRGSIQDVIQNAFDLAPVGMAVVALTGDWVAVNRKLCEILGYSSEDLRARRFQDITHPDDLAGDLDLALQLVSGTIQSYTIQKRYLRGDGQTIWARLSGTLIRDDANAPARFLGVIDPLPDLEAAAVRLALGRAPGAEDASEGVWELDTVSGQVFSSPPISSLLGWGTSTVAPTLDGYFSLVHPDDADHVKARLAEYLDGRTPDFRAEFRMRRNDGTWRWMQTSGRALTRDENGRPVRLAGLHSDVTQRREVAADLARSRAALAIGDARFQALMESGAHVVWISDANGKGRDISTAWRTFTGQSLEEAANDGWAKAVHPEDLHATLTSWREAVANDSPFAITHRVRRHDGVYRLMVARGSPVRNASGETIEWVGTHTDIGDDTSAMNTLSHAGVSDATATRR